MISLSCTAHVSYITVLTIGMDHNLRNVAWFRKQKGQGAPAREPVVNEEEQKKMMAFYYKKQEEFKVWLFIF